MRGAKIISRCVEATPLSPELRPVLSLCRQELAAVPADQGLGGGLPAGVEHHVVRHPREGPRGHAEEGGGLVDPLGVEDGVELAPSTIRGVKAYTFSPF